MKSLTTFVVTLIILANAKNGYAEEKPSGNEFYQIRFSDQIKIKLSIEDRDYWLSSYPDAYGYNLDSLSGACKGNASEMHVVSAAPIVSGTDTTISWKILPEHGSADDSKQGIPVKNGSIVRLQNVNTNRDLHAQGCRSIKTPLDMQVSTCLHDGGGSVNADWKVEFDGELGKVLEIGSNFRLRHNATGWLLNANNLQVTEKRDGLEVSAHVQSLEDKGTPAYSSWYAEKKMSDSKSDSCASAKREIVLRKINDLITEATNNYRSASNETIAKIDPKLTFDVSKFWTKVRDGAGDVGVTAISEAGGFLYLWNEAKAIDMKKTVVVVSILATFKVGPAAYSATSYGGNSLYDAIFSEKLGVKANVTDVINKQIDIFLNGWIPKKNMLLFMI